jgi:hypothetical protein
VSEREIDPMLEERQKTPRVLVVAAAMSAGLLIAIAAQAALAQFGLDLGAVWRGLAPRAAQLRAAFAWWLIAGVSFVAGFLFAALAKYLFAHPNRFVALRWLGGAAVIAGLVLVGRQAVAPSGLPPAASVLIGVAVLVLAGMLSLLGAFFVVRR